MEFSNYRVYLTTDKIIRKKFSEEVLSKYYKQIGFLYQNGYELNCENDEVEEQLAAFDFFKNDNSLEELNSIEDYKSDLSYGRKLISEELYDIIRETTFLKQDLSSPNLIKICCKNNWEKIKNNVDRIDSLFNSKDSEICGNYNLIPNIEDIQKRILEIKERINKEYLVLTWISTKELVNIIYSIYVRFSKPKNGELRSSIKINLNDEIYGGLGGYNPADGKIKCMAGSAIWDVKSNYSGSTDKIKITVSRILNGGLSNEHDDEYIKFLEKWYNTKSLQTEENNKKAKQVVINSLLIGIFNLLLLKHEMNLLKNDTRNSLRAKEAINEMKAILRYCCIPNSYLL